MNIRAGAIDNSMKEEQITSSGEALLYEQVAARIQHLIEEGVLRPGERVPSVRQVSRQQNVSVSTAFQAYVDTRELLAPSGLDHNLQTQEGYVLGEVASGVTITVTPKSAYGLETATAGTALMTASGSETRTRKKLEGMQAAGAPSISYRIGDASAVSNGWTLDALIVEHKDEGRG